MMAKVTSPSLTAGERVSRWLEKHMGLLLLLPASLIFLFLTVFPCSTMPTSLSLSMRLSADFEFIGLENYDWLFSDELFVSSIKNTLRFCFQPLWKSSWV